MISELIPEQLLDKEQTLQLMEDIPFFKNFTSKEMEYLAKLASNVLRYQVADVIIKEGDHDLSFYVLLRGVVCVTKGHPRETVIAKLRAGSVFGELAWIDKRPRITNVIADGDVVALKIDLTDVERFGPALQSKIKDQIISILITRLDQTNEQLASLAR